MRYRGQVHEVRVPVPTKVFDADALGRLTADFEARYNRRYGRGAAYGQAELEARTYLVRGVGRLVKPQLRPQYLGGEDPAGARSGERAVFFRQLGGFVSTAIYRRDRLEPGNRIRGPAVIEAADTTVLVHPGQEVRVDSWTNIAFERM
jgi:N-methylhydantoinase A